MPTADGSFKSISVPEIPWQKEKPEPILRWTDEAKGKYEARLTHYNGQRIEHGPCTCGVPRYELSARHAPNCPYIQPRPAVDQQPPDSEA